VREFMSSKKSMFLKYFMDSDIAATENDTTVLLRSIYNPMRVMENDTAKKVREIEARGTTLEELITYASGKVGKKAYETGDTKMGVIAVGECVGLIDDIKSVKEIVEGMVAEAETDLKRLHGIFNG